MATRLPDTDVVIIGLGAAGGVAVQPLTEAGLEVVGLEAGSRLTRRDFAPDEIRNNVRAWPFAVQKTQLEVPTQRPNRSVEARQTGGHPMMNAVGGTTLHYWAQSWRLNPWDFKVVGETTRRYGASRIPEGSTVEDWPFGYEELEPYYDRVEHELGVSGQAGNIAGEIDLRGNRFEGSRRRGYPMPPLRWTGFIERMADNARGLGWDPFPGPAAVNTRPYQKPVGLHVSRILQPWRVPRRRKKLDGRDDDSTSGSDRQPEGCHARARHQDRSWSRRTCDRGDLPPVRRGVLPAGKGRAVGELHI